jgi:hypothetical protein
VLPNNESADTWSRYVAAPGVAPHRRVNVVGCITELSAGAPSSGVEMIVKKLQEAHQGDVPPVLEADTRHQYRVRVTNGPTCRKVSVTAESVKMIVLKSESVETTSV